MTDTYRLRVYLHDELPRIGSGWRDITYQEKREWVYVWDTYKPERRHRVRLRQLEELEARA